MDNVVYMPEDSLCRIPSPWGRAVKERLLELHIKQKTLHQMLVEMGFDIEKAELSNLLYGLGTSNRRPEIEAVNKIVGIAFRPPNVPV